MKPLKACALASLLACLGSSAAAQFSQYTRPGRFDASPVTVKAEIDQAVDDAKWTLGRVRADPWFALREITYDDNVGTRPDEGPTRSDFTATIGAGVRAYLPFGSDMVLAAHLLPEYVWWQELSDRRRVNGRVGVGVFGSAGRTTLEASVARLDEARFYSREFEDQVNTSDEVGFLSLEVDLEAGFSLFGSGRLRRLSFRDEDPDVSQVKVLDREETVYRAGVRYAFERGLSIGVGAEDSEVEFEAVDDLRSNSGTSPLVELRYAGEDLFFVVEVVDRDLEFPAAPELLDFDEITGSARGEWELFERLRGQAWARRDLVYSFTDRWAYFEETATGVGLKASAASWLAVRVFGETGTTDYRPVAAGIPQRGDDFDSYGIEFQFEARRAVLRLEFSTTEYDSNLAEFDRDVTVIRSGLVFGSRMLSPWS